LAGNGKLPIFALPIEKGAVVGKRVWLRACGFITRSLAGIKQREVLYEDLWKFGSNST